MTPNICPCDMCEIAHYLQKIYHRDFREKNCNFKCKAYEDYLFENNIVEPLENFVYNQTDIAGDK